MNELDVYEIVTPKEYCIKREFIEMEDSIYDFNFTFGDLRSFIEPEPQRGRVNKVLRKHFFDKDDQGYWIRKNNVEEYMDGTPSSPYWEIDVLPILISLLENEYGINYKICKWVLNAVEHHVQKND